MMTLNIIELSTVNNFGYTHNTYYLKATTFQFARAMYCTFFKINLIITVYQEKQLTRLKSFTFEKRNAGEIMHRIIFYLNTIFTFCVKCANGGTVERAADNVST
jgi:hypothetical protein